MAVPPSLPKLKRTAWCAGALTAGLERVDVPAADKFRTGEVAFTLAYYGDINNRIMLEAEPHRKDFMRDLDGQRYEPDGSYDQDMATLVARPTERNTREEYRSLLDQYTDRQYWDELARIMSPIAFGSGLSERGAKKLLPDLAAYLTSRVVGSEIRDRLQRPLKQALLDGDEVCLVSHSMGCIVSYDVLWKFSRMSEYREVRDHKVSLWLTLGSPLGDAWVQDNLYDSDEPEDGKYPNNIGR